MKINSFFYCSYGDSYARLSRACLFSSKHRIYKNLGFRRHVWKWTLRQTWSLTIHVIYTLVDRLFIRFIVIFLFYFKKDAYSCCLMSEVLNKTVNFYFKITVLILKWHRHFLQLPLTFSDNDRVNHIRFETNITLTSCRSHKKSYSNLFIAIFILILPVTKACLSDYSLLNQIPNFDYK